MNYKMAKLFDADSDIGQRWFVYYFFKNPETGKYIRFRRWISSRLLTRAQRYNKARDLIRETNLKLQKGFNPFVQQPGRPSLLIQIINEYLEIKRLTLRYRSYISYKSYLKHFIAWLTRSKLEKIECEAFNSQHATRYMDYVLKEKRRNNRTYNNILQVIRSFFNFVTTRQYIEINPFARLGELPTEETEIIAFNRAELDVIAKELPAYNYDLYVIALMVFTCFIRPQEIVRLRVRHLVDLQDQLRLSGDITKNRKNETIIIPPQLREAIAHLDLSFPGEYYVFGNHLKRCTKKASANCIFTAWREFAQKFHLDKTLYALKHTGNGMALEAGANARDLQLQNRHSSLDETQRYLDRFSRVASERFLNSFPRL